jgi:hypothetical protein
MVILKEGVERVQSVLGDKLRQEKDVHGKVNMRVILVSVTMAREWCWGERQGGDLMLMVVVEVSTREEV